MINTKKCAEKEEGKREMKDRWGPMAGAAAVPRRPPRYRQDTAVEGRIEGIVQDAGGAVTDIPDREQEGVVGGGGAE